MAESFLSGLGVFKRKTDLLLVAGTSVLAWLCEAGMYWTIARGFGDFLQEKVGIAATLLTTGVANLATLIPSSPGYVGPFESGVTLVVNGALDVPRGEALSYAIVVHAALWFPITRDRPHRMVASTPQPCGCPGRRHTDATVDSVESHPRSGDVHVGA